MSAHVMVAEDDLKQAELVRLYLRDAGHTVVVVHDGRSVIDEVRHRCPDLLILDLMMPKIDGWEVCRILRGESDLPILMLTARSTKNDLLQGLDSGADDYLTKPYDPRELMARVRALLRRSQRADDPAAEVLTVGELVIDPARYEVTMRGEPVVCTAGEFIILQTLAARVGQVFSRAALLEPTRGSDRYGTERTIDVHISNLRRKLELDPRRPQYLLTVFGVGYKLASDRPPSPAPRRPR